MRKKGYVAALKEAKHAADKLRLAMRGNLDPIAYEMASDLRSIIAMLHGDQNLLGGRKMPEIFAKYPEGTLGHEVVKGTKEFLNFIADAAIARDGKPLRALADAVEADPEGVDSVRSFLVILFLPLEVNGKPYLPAMTLKNLRKFVFERTKVDVKERDLSKLCKGLGIKVKRDDIGRPRKSGNKAG